LKETSPSPTPKTNARQADGHDQVREEEHLGDRVAAPARTEGVGERPQPRGERRRHARRQDLRVQRAGQSGERVRRQVSGPQACADLARAARRTPIGHHCGEPSSLGRDGQAVLAVAQGASMIDATTGPAEGHEREMERGAG